MAYSDNFPATRPVFMADFANGGKIDPRATFSRPDSPIDATKAAASAVHFWSNEKHLSSENLILYSNGFDSGFSGTSTTRLASTSGQSDPTGGTNASQLSQQAGQTSAGALYFSHSNLTVGQEYTWSIYVKNNGRTVPRLTENFSSGGSQRHTWFDTSSIGTVGTSDAAHTPLITKLGDWFRITIRFTADAASGAVYLYITSTDASATVADDGAGYYAYGASLSTTGQLVHEDTSGQIARSYAPSLKSVATAGAARFEYDPTDGQSMGVLIEGQAQNLATYSSDFSNAAWSKTRTSVEASAAIGPDGTLSASLIRDETSTNNTHHVYQLLPSIASGTVVTASVFAKAAGRTFLIIQNGSTTPFGGASYKVWFNLTSGTVGTISGSGVTASATDCGNGWTRCAVTFPASTATGTHALQINSSEGDNDEYHVGDSYSGVLLFGAQYEQNSLSSLISTSGSTATRAADSLSVAMAGIYDGGPVTLTGEFETSPASTASRIYAQMDDGAGNDKNRITLLENPTNFKVFVTSDGASQVAETSAASSGTFKKAVSLDTNDYASVLNAGAAITDTSATLPSIGSGSKLFVGCGPYSGNELNAHVKRVAVYSEALTDTNLQALTS